MAEQERRLREEEAAAAREGHQVIPDPWGHPPRMIRRDCRRPSRGREGRETLVGMRGESGTGWRSREQGGQRGRRSPPALARSERQRTRVVHRRCRGIMRGILCGGSRGGSGVGGQGRWRRLYAT